MPLVILILLAILLLFVIVMLAKTVRIIPQARAGIVERFGKYKETLPAGLNIVAPFIDRVRYIIDLREQVVSFPPQPVITEDNLVVSIDTVIYKGIDPPPSIKDSMEKQMRADREKRAVILTAEGQRQAAILTAEGAKQSSILNAEGARESQILRAQADRESSILRAQGEGQAIQTVFQAIHDGRPDQSLLAYQYLQMMPKIAEGDANKVWIVPSEIGRALEGLGSTMNSLQGIPQHVDGPAKRVDMGPSEPTVPGPDAQLSQTNAAVEAAIAEADRAANPGKSALPDPEAPTATDPAVDPGEVPPTQ